MRGEQKDQTGTAGPRQPFRLSNVDPEPACKVLTNGGELQVLCFRFPQHVGTVNAAALTRRRWLLSLKRDGERPGLFVQDFSAPKRYMTTR